ncbi:DUF2746 domain-containing protein [Gordonia sp. (in: high G+C Gram-positive bacteria)]|uniref:DUF2746 domain-containing protein n=1 Tax=Gordonia sp. (in: high G+C Gram-positive bacteria) TaxID=84139 RepID=UPI003C78E42F
MLWRGRLTDAKNARQHEEQNAAIGEVREQVANDHDSNLRDDIDKILDAVALVDERTRRIGDDQRREVAARRDGDRRIADHLSDIGERLDRQDRIAAKHHPEEL